MLSLGARSVRRLLLRIAASPIQRRTDVERPHQHAPHSHHRGSRRSGREVTHRDSPGWAWQNPIVTSASWPAMVELLTAFVAAHRRLPTVYGNPTHVERELSKWLRTQRSSLHDGTLSPVRAEELYRRVPGWASPAEWLASKSREDAQ
ncbi:helicase associated domain-containing protein [Nakamurella alba]|uniref:helicase associated domain-containing protein n=1 Tax=Nakamurella alba TaxID=2665158 RepID=UPI003898FB11